MSEVAGRMAVQAGAKYLERYHGGRGLLLGGVPGVPPADVVILGGGVVGTNAAKIAAGMGAHVRILDVSLHRLRYLSDVMPANVDLIYSNRYNILEQIEMADLLIGAVLLPGTKAPMLVQREDLKRMKNGSVIVDVAVDQGGCVETIKPTTHENPIYEIDGVVHYGVANMPGGVPRTSTLALTNATFPYAQRLARQGWKKACQDDPSLALGLNVVGGKVVYAASPRRSTWSTRTSPRFSGSTNRNHRTVRPQRGSGGAGAPRLQVRPARRHGTGRGRVRREIEPAASAGRVMASIPTRNRVRHARVHGRRTGPDRTACAGRSRWHDSRLATPHLAHHDDRTLPSSPHQS
jgi:hypothetical protein